MDIHTLYLNSTQMQMNNGILNSGEWKALGRLSGHSDLVTKIGKTNEISVSIQNSSLSRGQY